MLVERVYIIVYDLLPAFFSHPSFTGNCTERGKNRDTKTKIFISRKTRLTMQENAQKSYLLEILSLINIISS